MAIIIKLQVRTKLFQTFYKKVIKSHMSAFFIIAALNERCSSMSVPHLKYFPL